MGAEWSLPRLQAARAVPRGLEAWLEAWQGRRETARVRRRSWAERAEAVLAAREQTWMVLQRDSMGLVRRVRREWARSRGREEEARTRALALVAAVIERELGLRVHREQVMGAIALDEGLFVEMATGEGKTLTLALAAVLAAWRGRACHVLTANDYLAQRDARQLEGVYAGCGLSVAAVVSGLSASERQRRHRAAIVYATSRELVGDFLRDRLRLGGRVTMERWRPWVMRHGGRAPAVVLPRVHTVLVDEADQVLVDDAVTPLIISAPKPGGLVAALGAWALEEARGLTEGRDFRIDRARREVRVDVRVVMNPPAEATGLRAVPRWRQEWLAKALEALHLLVRDRHYFVREGKVVLIDESTGRPMPDRTLGEGLHTLLELKEGLAPSPTNQTMASVSFQRFFRQVPVLAGVSGTVADAAAELWRLYRRPVLAIAPHRPVRRIELPLCAARNDEEKWVQVVASVHAARAAGQPVLIGTRTVAASERLSERLRAEGVPHALLNAVRNEAEAAVIAAAGHAGQVTIATNMAGRGTDIVPVESALAVGGLRVIATEGHRSTRVDRQLAGRCGRQGQPGVVERIWSWDDELLQHFVPRWLRELGRRRGGRRSLALAYRWAQFRAARQDAQQRLAVLRQDQWLDDHLALGGELGSKARNKRGEPRAAVT